MLQIRQAGIKDIAIIHELGRQTFFHTYLPFISGDQVNYMFNMMYEPSSLELQMKDKEHIFLIACDNENSCRFLLLTN